MTALYLVRHAQASFGTHDYDRLSPRGREQARLMGQYFAHATPQLHALHCGEMQRHRETAQAVIDARRAAGLGELAIATDARLNELDVAGQFQHLIPRIPDADGTLVALREQSRTSSSAYQQLLRRVYRHWQELTEPVADLESWDAFARRVWEAVEAVAQDTPPGGSAIIVTSGGVIASVAQQLLALPREEAYPLFEVLRNCSVSQLLHDRRRMSIATYNECSYLEVFEQLHGIEGLVTHR